MRLEGSEGLGPAHQLLSLHRDPVHARGAEVDCVSFLNTTLSSSSFRCTSAAARPSRGENLGREVEGP